jgi:threonine/homoserine/homoserine lactone efflux protein
MTLGAAASFAALADNPLQLGALVGTFFAFGALPSLSLWCLAGLLLARLLRTDTQLRMLNIVLGVPHAVSIAPVWFE